MKTMYDIYTPDGQYRGSFDNDDKAIYYAMRHDCVVVNRNNGGIVWSLQMESTVYNRREKR